MANQTPSQFSELLNLQFEQPSKVKDKSYGLKLVKELYKDVNGTDTYYGQRRLQWAINETFAKGTMKPHEFIKFLGIEGNDAYVNIDPTLLKIVPRYMQVLLGGFMNREDRASVSATGILSYQKKQQRKTAAEFRMKNAPVIAQMQETSGIQHETGYTPQDQDELDWHYKIVDRLPEETGFEKRVDEIFQNSDDDNLKRELLSDLAKYNIAATKIVEINAKTRTLANRLRVKRCKPGRTVYNVFERPNGEDVSLIGEAYPMSIAEGRRQFPDIEETDWFKLAEKTSKGANLYSSLRWIDSYLTDYSRPYDEYKFQVFDFEVKRTDTEFSVKKKTEAGSDRLYRKAGKPNPTSGEAVEEKRFNIYGGVWAIDTDIMLKWGLVPNQIRAYQNGIDCFSTYSIVCPDADGTLIPALIERGIPMVRALIDTFLKIQLMKRTMIADGIAVDIEGIDDIDLGAGKLSRLQVMKIYQQTGRLYWQRKEIDGVANPEQNPIPFQQIPNGANVAQINTLIGLYNFELQRLNDEWGTNPDALGQQLPARRGKQVNENQIEMANQATEYIYDHYLMLKKITANKLIMKLWDISIFEASDYKEMDDVDIKELMEMEFDANVDFVPMNTDRQWLEQMISLAIEKGTISMGEAIRIRNMDNIKDAELYLIRLEKKAMAAQAKAQSDNIKETLAGQQDTAAKNADNEAKLIGAKAEADSLVSTGKLQQEGYNSVINMVSGIVQDCIKLGKPVPTEYTPLVNYVIQTTLAKGNPQPQQQEPPQEQAQDQQPESPQEDQQEQPM